MSKQQETATVNRDTVEEFWNEDVLAQCRSLADRTDPTDFLNQLGHFLGASGRMWAAVSARDALQLFLETAVDPVENTVLICSFNCPVVAESVIHAGCRVETFDLDESNGRIDWHRIEQLLKPHHAALIVPHLFGVPADFRPIQRTAEKLNILLIEDCAPTLGGKINGVMAGVLGDAAIFSFNFDKPISLGGGGALLVNNPDLWPRMKAVPQPPSLDVEVKELEQFLLYLKTRRDEIRPSSVSLQNRIKKRLNKWMPNHLTNRPAFPVSGIGPLRAALGLWQLERYPDILSQRNRNADLFSPDTGCRSWYVGDDVTPAWLRQKVMPDDRVNVDSTARHLQEQGLRVGRLNWPVTIDTNLNRPEERPCAEYAAEHGLDIPVHQNMKPDELHLIRRTLLGDADT